MIIYGLDPGTEISAIVGYDSHTKGVIYHAVAENQSIAAFLYTESKDPSAGLLVIEKFESFGMAVGREVFETVWWSGRFYELWSGPKEMMARRDVKIHLCGSSRATDANVRQAILDAFGGKIRAIGKQKEPGPLYGITGHKYAALALALTRAGHAGA